MGHDVSDGLREAEQRYELGHPIGVIVGELLELALAQANHQDGFVAEWHGGENGHGHLRTLAISAPSRVVAEFTHLDHFPLTVVRRHQAERAAADAGDTLRIPGLPAALGPVVSYAGLPLMYRDTCVGVMVLLNGPSGNAADLPDALAPICAMCATLLWADRGARTRLGIERRRADLLELDRAQFVTELHDDLGQLLTCAQLQIDMVGDGVPGLEGAQRSIGAASQALRGLVSRARGPSSALAPHAEMWETSLRRLCENAGLRFDFKAPQEPWPLEAGPLLDVLQIIKLAVTHAVRHTNATRVEVDFHHDDQQLRVRVRDDGRSRERGDVSGTVETPGGHSISLMLERAARIDAHLSMDVNECGGTTLLLGLPRP